MAGYDLDVRASDELEVVPGGIEQVHASSAELGIRLPWSSALRVGPVLSASIKDLPVRPIEVVIVEEVSVVLEGLPCGTGGSAG
jgi:hypothetical protein